MLTQLARRLGGVAILGIGAVHLQQSLVQDFRGIPTIQILFLLNVIGAAVVGLCLLAPLDRVLSSRLADMAVALLAVVGLTIAVGSLVGLFISENGTLFGLHTARYSTPAVLAIVAEGAAVLLLTPVLAATTARALGRGPGGTGQDRRAPSWRDRAAPR
jgi:hypothetical protein